MPSHRASVRAIRSVVPDEPERMHPSGAPAVRTFFSALRTALGQVRAVGPRPLRKRARASRIAIVGTGTEARQLAAEVMTQSDAGYDVACLVSLTPEPADLEIECSSPRVRRLPVIAADRVRGFARRHGIRRIVIPASDCLKQVPAEVVLGCRADGCEIDNVQTFYEIAFGRIPIIAGSPEPLILGDALGRSRVARAIKRAVDVTAASGILVLTAPLGLLFAALIKLEDGGPVFFGQMRVGHYATTFKLRKFRSMRVDAEAETGPVWAQADDPRVTRVGKWMRALRIDEIPQAWNVLRGEMSFVGPRPERPEFVETLRTAIPFYEYRHTVRPGITGWAQVNFPYTATVDDARQKLEYDLYYVKNFSGPLDVAIMLRTIKIVLFGWGSR